MSYENSNLWQMTLASQPNDRFEKPRSFLRSMYESFWQRGLALSQTISNQLPDLTRHDEPHLSALWERASQLTGPKYEINPLEAFIFGGAVLLHDAGHAFSTYKNGIAELRLTVEYTDAHTGYLKSYLESKESTSNESDAACVSVELSSRADAYAKLNALRRRHADSAISLASQDFNGQYLIDNAELRESLSSIIGIIAASHHWKRERLEDYFHSIVGVPSSMPTEWSINPLKIALLLRCADAIQIDQCRAPSFSFALHQPTGVSRSHWLAQRLNQPAIRNLDSGPGELVFTAQSGFPPEDADAWWIARDLISVADAELRGCFRLMRSLRIPTFSVDRVAGAQDPQNLATYIGTTGWKPVDASVRINNVSKIVEVFGGAALYGRNPAIALRELIQNAGDAVRARAEYLRDPFYSGTINVSVESIPCSSDVLLCVMDNGTGMSEEVLTRTLVDFGQSFWTSEDAQYEFPGLVSSKLRQTGRYGIGFFATLMVTDRVSVISRRYDKNNEIKKLVFNHGLKSRPILMEVDASSLGIFSTRVELQVTLKMLRSILSCGSDVNFISKTAVKITLKELVAHICPCLDCNVYSTTPSCPSELAHSSNWFEQDALVWLREILLADRRAQPAFDAYLLEAAPRLQVLYDIEGQPVGRAAVAFGVLPTGIGSIGGLISGSHSTSIRQFSKNYVGALSMEPEGPRRFGLTFDPKCDIASWATQQAALTLNTGSVAAVQHVTARNVAYFGGDPTKIAHIMINDIHTNLTDVYNLLMEKGIILVIYEPDDGTNPSRIARITRQVGPGSYQSFRFHEINIVGVVMERWNFESHSLRRYYDIVDDPNDLSSYLSCLRRYIASMGVELILENESDSTVAMYIGQNSPRENLQHGDEIRSKTLEMKLR